MKVYQTLHDAKFERSHTVQSSREKNPALKFCHEGLTLTAGRTLIITQADMIFFSSFFCYVGGRGTARNLVEWLTSFYPIVL